MLATASLHRLVQNSKSDGVLCGRFLPSNNNTAFVDTDSVCTVTIVEQSLEGLKPVAFGAFHVCSKNQAYFMISKYDNSYEKKFVELEQLNLIDSDVKINKNRHRCFKIIESSNEPVNYSALPAYYGAFSDRSSQHVITHIYDKLVAMSLKTTNLDLTKNITIDFFDPEEFGEDQRTVWRDLTGFVVTDNFRFYELTLQKDVLQGILKKDIFQNDSITFEDLNADNEFHVQDYDSNTSLFDRQKYIEFLLNIKEINGVIALQQNQPVGYVLAIDNRITQCYADDENIASGLMSRMTDRIMNETVTMYIKGSKYWLCNTLINNAKCLRQVRRFHTRLLPSHIKWSNIYILNIGLHIY